MVRLLKYASTAFRSRYEDAFIRTLTTVADSRFGFRGLVKLRGYSIDETNGGVHYELSGSSLIRTVFGDGGSHNTTGVTLTELREDLRNYSFSDLRKAGRELSKVRRRHAAALKGSGNVTYAQNFGK